MKAISPFYALNPDVIFLLYIHLLSTHFNMNVHRRPFLMTLAILAMAGVSQAQTSMQTIFHPANSRGHADHGWLDTYHSFSFASWRDAERMHFGALRVLNDDAVTGGAGFGTHPHDNMEIVSIPLSGDLEHHDSMGNKTVIREGDVQIMSAGTGIMHSEKNHNADEDVRFLQIWVFPNQRAHAVVRPNHHGPRRPARSPSMRGVPDGAQGVKIHQNAWFHVGQLSAGWTDTYAMHDTNQGLYAMVLEGEASVGGLKLGRRDAIGVWDTGSVSIEATEDTRLLLIEVPMQW